MRSLICSIVTCLMAPAWGQPALAAQASFTDPMNAAALMATSPDQQPLISITATGQHAIAVGPRGLVITSSDAGASWTQATVPLQSDLVAVQFYDAQTGWACGHDGVILHSGDGGKTWIKQLDGISARTIFESYYSQRIATGDNSVSSELQEIKTNFDQGPNLPWLGIWFVTSRVGFVVGPFGDIAYTNDGGTNWVPWLDHIDNPNFLALNAIGTAGGHLYIAGEQGTVYIYDPSRQTFIARPTSYTGSLFGLAGSDKTLIVYGLRGTIFRSEDQGKSWVQSQNSTASSIMDGVLMPDGHFVLVTVDGIVLVSSDDGVSFHPMPAVQNAPLSGIAAIGDALVMSSLAGVRHAPGA